MDIDIENIEDLKNSDTALESAPLPEKRLMIMVELMQLVKERMLLHVYG